MVYSTFTLPDGDEVHLEASVSLAEGDFVVVGGIRYRVKEAPVWYVNQQVNGRVTGGPLIMLEEVPR